MHRTIKTIVIGPTKTKIGHSGIRNRYGRYAKSNLMSDQLLLTPRSYYRESDMFGVDTQVSGQKKI